jgi:hypothetical protein
MKKPLKEITERDKRAFFKLCLRKYYVKEDIRQAVCLKNNKAYPVYVYSLISLDKSSFTWFSRGFFIKLCKFELLKYSHSVGASGIWVPVRGFEERADHMGVLEI